MAVPTTKLVCRKPDCKVPTGGVCSEGHQPPESCPNFGELDPIEEEDSSAVYLNTGNTVELPSGEALGVVALEEFLRWRLAKFITIVGEKDSGKTTLICSLYDRFLKGVFSDFAFSESRTLVGLERRSHYSRIDSGGSVPDTAHTSIQEGLQFLHLAIADTGAGYSRHDLMFSDRAGESYRNVQRKPALAKELTEITNAHRVLLLLDGGRVATPTERAGAIQAVRQTLRALIEGGALSSTANVQVVTSKVDLIQSHANRTSLESQLAEFRSQLQQDFGGLLGALTFWDIAARDPTGTLLPAHGLAALVKEWTAISVQRVPPYRRTLTLRTEFERLLEKPAGGVLP